LGIFDPYTLPESLGKRLGFKGYILRCINYHWVILLYITRDLATITYAHHALIQGNRNGAIIGTFLTLVLAIAFTACQGLEYIQASFSMSDSVFGTVFFASTGLHGLISVAPTKLNINKNSVKIRKIHYTTPLRRDLPSQGPSNLAIKLPNKNFYIDKNFIEWLVGFVDAEGNFNISLKNFKDNNYNSLVLTFQIGLHIDDLEVLKFIQKNLGCGKISISGNKCNFFVNDRASLINIIIPVFNFIELKSSKYNQFLVFEKAVNLIKNKNHLTAIGRLEIIKLYHEIKNPPICLRSKIEINKYWLGGFVDGAGSFSITQNNPRLKFENHVKELPLFNSIAEFFKSGNVNITNPRKNRINSNPTVTLDYTNIHLLKNVVVPLFSTKLNEFKLLNSKKEKDFNDWAILVDIKYYGYHNIPEGVSLFKEIISQWNNFRLSTNAELGSDGLIPTTAEQEKLVNPNLIDFNEKFRLLLNIPAPYIIKDGIRFYRDTLNLVSDKIKIVSNDSLNNESVFSSISECSRILQLDRAKIKNCLINGGIYKNYKFKFHSHC
jgi:hypothetical protein